MVCRHCKAHLKRGMKRCPYCGEELRDYRAAAAVILCILLVAGIAGLSVYYIHGSARKQNPDRENQGTAETEFFSTEEESIQVTAEVTASNPDTESDAVRETQENTIETAQPGSEGKAEIAENPEEESSKEESSEAGKDPEADPEEEPAEPVDDGFSGLSQEEVSVRLEKEEFAGRMAYVEAMFGVQKPEYRVPQRLSERSRTDKPDVLYVKEVLSGLNDGIYEAQAFSDTMSSGAAAEIQVYRAPGYTEAAAILYTDTDTGEIDTFIYHGGKLRYAENFEKDGAAWFMNDYMTGLFTMEELEEMSDYEVQNTMRYYELTGQKKKAYEEKEEQVLSLAYEVYERAVTDRNYANVQLQLVLQAENGEPVSYDIQEVGAVITVTSDYLEWDGLRILPADFYYVDEVGWCTDFYLPALSAPYTLSASASLTEKEGIEFYVDYNFRTDGTDQYKNLGQIILSAALPPEESSAPEESGAKADAETGNSYD